MKSEGSSLDARSEGLIRAILGKHQRASSEALSLVAAALLGKGASLGEEAVLADSGRAGEVAAGVGRVRSLAFLSILT